MAAADCDVAVIGGGILGAGAAQACAAAGYDTVLVERSDWAAGTSSRSSKLIHGGLRYLESGQLLLVRESLRERAILLRIAPHLVRPLAFHIPVYASTRRRPWELRAGLAAYALLAGWTPLARFEAYAPPKLPDGLAASGLRTDGLQAVFRYFDAQTDDARLTRAVVRSAETLGVATHRPARLVKAERDDDGDGGGYRLLLDGNGRTLELRCRYLVVATGPWIDGTLAGIVPAATRRALDLVLGSHLLIEPQIHAEAFYLESPVDGRAVFVLPWQGRTLLGTTERVFAGNPADAMVDESDREYLLTTLRHHFPDVAASVVGGFAGVRVLPHGDGRAFNRPRDCVFHVDANHPRLLALYGGKLTGYRATGQDVVAKVRQALGIRDAKADTATRILPDVD